MKKLIVYGLTLLLTACAGVVVSPAGLVQESPAEIVTDEAAEIPAEGATTPAEAQPSAVPTLLASATNTVVAVEATESQGGVVCETRGDGLVATDPATVQLASGGLQLVEFFAFW